MKPEVQASGSVSLSQDRDCHRIEGHTPGGPPVRVMPSMVPDLLMLSSATSESRTYHSPMSQHSLENPQWPARRKTRADGKNKLQETTDDTGRKHDSRGRFTSDDDNDDRGGNRGASSRGNSSSSNKGEGRPTRGSDRRHGRNTTAAEGSPPTTTTTTTTTTNVVETAVVLPAATPTTAAGVGFLEPVAGFLDRVKAGDDEDDDEDENGRSRRNNHNGSSSKARPREGRRGGGNSKRAE